MKNYGFGLVSIVLTSGLIMYASIGFASESSSYGSHYLPLQNNEPGISTLEERQQIIHSRGDVRVKVFPHNNPKWNSPAGVDSVTNHVKFHSAGTCKSYQANSDTSADPKHEAKPTSAGSDLTFDTGNFSESVWVICDQAPQIIRKGYESKPIRYAGKFFVKRVNPPKGKDYITIVNVLSEEAYMKGVVPSEMPSSWSYEALKVQAIAARSYFKYEIGVNEAQNDVNIVIEKSGAQLDDTVNYQAYLGLTNGKSTTDKAVDDTAGVVMTHKGDVIKAYFSADSGGHTENAENVWGEYFPYIIGKKEIYPMGSISTENWLVKSTYKEVQNKLIAKKLINETSPIIHMSISDFYTYGRTKQVLLKYENGTKEKVDGLEFTHAMGLKSNWLEFDLPATKTGTIDITGHGFGHGAGMNQWGSRRLVDVKGMSHRDILKFYYTGISFTK
jgi:SpoIID/LytB domain protein